MASKSGKIDGEVEVRTPADKFWNSIMDAATVFPKVFPHKYKSIEVVEGDGNSVGSVRLLTYAEGLPLTFVKEKIESVDEENKTVGLSFFDGDIAKYYKSFKLILAIFSKGDGSLVKWWCEFEKASDETPEPQLMIDFAVQNIKDLDAYLVGA